MIVYIYHKFHCMSVQYDKHIFIITNTMHTTGVDKITLFKNYLKQRIISYMFRSSLDHRQGGLYLIREATA